MAKKTSQFGSTIDKATETVGHALGKVAAVVESLPERRAEASELPDVLDEVGEIRVDAADLREHE